MAVPVQFEIAPDKEVLESARAGDPGAFCELCRMHEAGLLRQALRLCGNLSTAEDLAQESLVEAWKSLNRYNGRCEFSTWLCAILLNRYRHSLRRKRPFLFSFVQREGEDDLSNPEDRVVDDEARPDRRLEGAERAEIVRRCLQRLPAKQQQVVFMRFYVDESLSAIAAALDCSVGTVKSRLFHALERLRMMRELNGDFAENPFTHSWL
jgi:RNA polymerase sigma-70 factor, ECF subfamily